MLQEWLNSVSPPPTWSDLVQALSSATVGQNRLAEDIKQQYCHQDGEQATGPAPGEICYRSKSMYRCTYVAKKGRKERKWKNEKKNFQKGRRR